MSAVVPKELEVVGDYAFYSCPKLTGKVTLGEHTETIGFQAFLGTGITELEIKNADTVLGGMAFKNTSGLRKVTVPVDLTYAPCGKLNDSSYGYFAGTGVEEIHYTKGNTGVMPDRESPSVDTSYENASILTLEYGAGGTLKKVTYDEGITRIGDYAYNSNTAITDVLFAKSIEIIGTNNFNSVTKDNVKFYGHKDSYAETYANDLGVDFVPLFYPIITTGANEFLAGEEYTFEARTYSGIDQFTTDVSWAVDGQKSDKTVIDKNGLLKIASDESADSITVIADNGTNRSTFEAKIKQHTHEYSSEPIFHWTEDYTACDAVVKCQECNTEKNYTCTVTKTEENPTCSKEGKITYTATVTISDKEYTDIKEISQEKTDHTVVNMEGKTPTCTEEGLTEGSYCSECGEIIKQQRSIDALGHDLVKVDAVEPTEEMSGNIEYYMCNRCGKYFSDSDGEEETSLEELTLPAYGERHEHNWIEANRQEPTCTKTGLVIYTCQCGKQKEEVLNPLNHLIQVDKAISPTCTRNGLTEGSHCSVCNTIITPQKEIAAWGHKFTTTTTKATTNKDGSIVKKCTVCGHVDSMTTIYYPKTIILSGTSFVYSGKVQKPGITVVGSNGKIIPDSNYSIIYSSGCKNVGNYTLKIVFKNNYSGSVSKAYMIVPKGSSIKSLKAGSKKFTVKWTKQARQTTGYQLQYSTNSKFTKVKTVTIGKNSTVSKAISKLAGRKKYYVRIRTYTTVTGRKYYSAWSKTKSVVTKK